jgi:hypothetical protein
MQKLPLTTPIVLLSMGFLSAPLWAASYSGTSSFAFLNIPVGARATAMGQAFTSVPNDIQGLSYNPACLATMVASQLSLQHLTYVEDTNQESIAYGKAGRQEAFSWGASMNYLRVASIPRTVATNLTTGDGYTQEGDFSTYDMALGVSGAAPVTEDLVAGATVKMLHESLADATSTGGAADLGLLYRSNEGRSWNFGASLLNLGLASKFADAAVNLPLTLRAGFSGQPFAQWLFSSDYVKRRDTKGELDVGIEVTPRRVFSMRFGYRYPFERPDLGSFSDFSLGCGIRPGMWSLDYAFVPLGDLGQTHRISLNFRFKSAS